MIYCSGPDGGGITKFHTSISISRQLSITDRNLYVGSVQTLIHATNCQASQSGNIDENDHAA